jgi:hypothetical protein
MKLRRVIGVCSSTALLGSFAVLGVASGPAAAVSATSFGFTGATQTYTVPSDGSVCSLTIQAAGANGGHPSDEGAPPVGTGGTVTATFAVSPGAVISVDVGGVGGTSVAGTPSVGGGGGFGGGGKGGDAPAFSPGGGGGGGGATAIKDGGTVLLVAGGGGGSTDYFGGGGGGGGSGMAGQNGTQGGSGSQGGLGQGGTTSAGGAGGAPGGGTATAGGTGSAGVGGDGGNASTASGSGAGAGGGGGFFGGGGGGGSDASGSGGGGGGGAGFAGPTATAIGSGSITQDGSGNGAAQITPAAGSCPPILTIHKVVTGQVPDGTTFTIHVACSHPVITGVSDQASQTTVNEDLTFDSAGNPTAGTNPQVVASADDSCNVTETANGGATTVAYACTDNASGSPTFCQTSNQDVQFGSTSGATAAVTVTNTFPTAPPTPAAVLVTPKFTG